MGKLRKVFNWVEHEADNLLHDVEGIFHHQSKPLTQAQINANIKSQQCNNCNGPFNSNQCYELCPPPSVNETIQIKNEIPSPTNQTHQYIKENTPLVPKPINFQPSP